MEAARGVLGSSGPGAMTGARAIPGDEAIPGAPRGARPQDRPEPERQARDTVPAMSMGRSMPRAPDPARAHGAWVYLLVSILAGVLSAWRFDARAAACAGLAFLGVFVAASSLARAPERRAGRFGLGLGITGASAAAGVAGGADPAFLLYGLVAVFPAGASAWFALRHGFLSAGALCFAVVALVVAAPASLCAGGAPHGLGLLLLGLLAPFFAWRAWRTRVALRAESGWTREKLRALGWREAALALAWTALAVLAVHLAAAGVQ